MQQKVIAAVKSGENVNMSYRPCWKMNEMRTKRPELFGNGRRKSDTQESRSWRKTPPSGHENGTTTDRRDRSQSHFRGSRFR
jgi:hypothetical protein